MTEAWTSPTGDVLDDWSTGLIVRTTLPILVATSVLQMASGGVLQAFQERLLTEPSLLILVPVMIGTAGNLGSILCSRLATQLHLGGFELSPWDPTLRSNGIAVMALAGAVFSVLGVASWILGRLLGGTIGVSTLLLVSLVSGLLLALWVIVLSVASVALSYQLGYNPDDTTVPFVTNVCDVTGVFILFGSILVFV